MSRLLYNQTIVDKLQELIKKYPDWRFGQLLINCSILDIEDGFFETIIKDPYNDESETIWNRMLNNRFCFDSK